MNQLIPTTHEMTVFNEMANAAAKSPHYKKWGGRDGILMILLTARELGLPPMFALNGGVNLINGKPELSARAMSAVIRRAGHQFNVAKCDDVVCQITGMRKDTQEKMTVSYHIEEAKRSGLVKPGSAWQKTPSDMLFARALSRLARRLFSDVIGTCYVEDEIPRSEPDDEPEEESKIIPLVAEDVELIGPDEAKFLRDNLSYERINKLFDHFKIENLNELTRADFNSIKEKIEKEKGEGDGKE